MPVRKNGTKREKAEILPRTVESVSSAREGSE
jgi:hypothetical protein